MNLTFLKFGNKERIVQFESRICATATTDTNTCARQMSVTFPWHGGPPQKCQMYNPPMFVLVCFFVFDLLWGGGPYNKVKMNNPPPLLLLFIFAGGGGGRTGIPDFREWASFGLMVQRPLQHEPSGRKWISSFVVGVLALNKSCILIPSDVSALVLTMAPFS